MHFGSSGGIKLVARGNRETILGELGKISKITKLEETKAVEEGTVSLTVYCDDKDDIREDVFFRLSSIRTPILEMQSVRMSLEDIFLKDTQNQEPVPEEGLSYIEEESILLADEEVNTDAGDL